ncbi:hypothetical protein ACWEQG_01985 [Microbispora sp. NPDC004025]
MENAKVNDRRDRSSGEGRLERWIRIGLAVAKFLIWLAFLVFFNVERR